MGEGVGEGRGRKVGRGGRGGEEGGRREKGRVVRGRGGKRDHSFPGRR